jgi:LysR family transcriptional regulator, nitrogen assimilation regulatory protein
VDIKQLRYFIAIAEEGSLSAASHRLRIAQPSLSQHVIKIEQELGVTLVRRSPRGITLTESGDILLRHAREICQSMNVCQAHWILRSCSKTIASISKSYIRYRKNVFPS